MVHRMLVRNEIIKGEVVDINHEGFGIIKHEGFIVLVPYTCIGEEIEVKILKVMKSCAFGKVEQILKASQTRVDANCDVYLKCGGCSLRHLDYQNECEIKEKYVLETLKRIGNQDLSTVKVLPIVGAKQCDNYRNKAQYPISLDNEGKAMIGFYAPRTHNVVDHPNCALQPALFSEVVKIIKAWIDKYKISVYSENMHQGLLRHLYLRFGEVSDELMLCLVINGEKVPFLEQLIQETEKIKQITSFILNVNTRKTNVILGEKNLCVYGKETISDVLCDIKLEISPLSFYQVNHEQAQRLYEIARDFAMLEKNETLIDLYCGAGSIGLSMARDVKKVIGVEIMEAAIVNARQNALNNNIENAEFYCGDATILANDLAEKQQVADCIIVDPPRKGLSDEVIAACIKMQPKRIVYISCNCATLARDLEIFTKDSYVLDKVQCVDLFPRTIHVESVALLVRKS